MQLHSCCMIVWIASSVVTKHFSVIRILVYAISLIQKWYLHDKVIKDKRNPSCPPLCKFGLFLSISVNSDHVLQRGSMRKYIWKHTQITNTFNTKFYCTIIFYIRESWAYWKFSSWLRDAPDIYRFPSVHMVKTHFLLENLLISKPPLSILEKFQT